MSPHPCRGQRMTSQESVPLPCFSGGVFLIVCVAGTHGRGFCFVFVSSLKPDAFKKPLLSPRL